MYRELDQVLAYHCGPALAGVKAANLVSLSLEEFPELRETAAEYNRLFQGKGVSFRLLCGCGKRALLLVYREEQLARQLRSRWRQSCCGGMDIPRERTWNACWIC